MTAPLLAAGAAMLGVVLVPIVHFYGPKEVNHILRESGAQAFITADQFGHRDFVADLPRSLEGTTELELVVVRGDDRPGGAAYWNAPFGAVFHTWDRDEALDFYRRGLGLLQI